MTTLDDLGMLLNYKGDYDGAEPLFRRSLEIRDKVLGPEHPDTAISLANLGSLLSDKGDYGAAEPLYRRELAIMEKINGLEHPDTFTSLQNFGVLLRNIGRLEEALTTLHESNERAKTVYGENSLERAYPLSALGQTHFLMNNCEEAGKYYKAALAIRESRLEPDDPAILMIQQKLEELAEARDGLE